MTKSGQKLFIKMPLLPFKVFAFHCPYFSKIILPLRRERDNWKVLNKGIISSPITASLIKLVGGGKQGESLSLMHFILAQYPGHGIIVKNIQRETGM